MINVSISDVVDVYEKAIKPHTKNKRKLYQFEKYRMQNIIEVCNSLKNFNSNYRCLYNIFIVFEPKCRVIMSLNIKDKIINHYFANKLLIEKLEKYLIDRNIATRKDMGTDYGRKKIKEYLEKCKKYDKFYILKLDISKFFYSIDHEVLKSLLSEKLDPEEVEILSTIIDTTNQDYINNNIKRIMEKYNVELPLYKNGKGLPIGNMTSQFLAIFYLYKLDFEIVHKLHIPYFIRYMDDFILIDPDRKKLKKAYEYIKSELENKYKLVLNSKKTMIVTNKEGFSFLGYHFRVINKKTIMNICSRNKRVIRKKVKENAWLYKRHYISFEKAFCSMQSYINNYRYGSSAYVKRIVESRWFDEFRK